MTKGSPAAVGVVFGVSVGILDVAGGWLHGHEGGERGGPGALGMRAVRRTAFWEKGGL